MAPGRLKAAALEGRDPLLTMSFPGWQLGSPLGTPQKGGHFRGHFLPPLRLPFLLTKGVQGGMSRFFPAHLVWGSIKLEAVNAAPLLPLPGPLPRCRQTWG